MSIRVDSRQSPVARLAASQFISPVNRSARDRVKVYKVDSWAGSTAGPEGHTSANASTPRRARAAHPSRDAEARRRSLRAVNRPRASGACRPPALARSALHIARAAGTAGIGTVDARSGRAEAGGAPQARLHHDGRPRPPPAAPASMGIGGASVVSVSLSAWWLRRVSCDARYNGRSPPSPTHSTHSSQLDDRGQARRKGAKIRATTRDATDDGGAGAPGRGH